MKSSDWFKNYFMIFDWLKKINYFSKSFDWFDKYRKISDWSLKINDFDWLAPGCKLFEKF